MSVHVTPWFTLSTQMEGLCAYNVAVPLFKLRSRQTFNKLFSTYIWEVPVGKKTGHGDDKMLRKLPRHTELHAFASKGSRWFHGWNILK